MQHRLVVPSASLRAGITPFVAVVFVAWSMTLASALTGNGALVHHAQLIQGGLPLWVATLVFLAGWQVMLWAMMIPASLHAIEAADPPTRNRFVSGYLTTWTGFGLLAFFSDVGLHATVSHSPWLAYHPWLIAGGMLVLAGTYQLSRLKERALDVCRMLGPVQELPPTYRGHPIVAGILYGAQCVGASGALMLVAFALGAGSLALMAGITAVMVWEVSPWGAHTVRVVGYALIVAGVFVLAGPIQGLPVWTG